MDGWKLALLFEGNTLQVALSIEWRCNLVVYGSLPVIILVCTGKK